MKEIDFTSFGSQKMLEKVIEDKEKVNKRNDLVNFNEKDFIELRLVSGNSDVSFYKFS